jgi:hypothetical protein
VTQSATSAGNLVTLPGNVALKAATVVAAGMVVVEDSEAAAMEAVVVDSAEAEVAEEVGEQAGWVCYHAKLLMLACAQST